MKSILQLTTTPITRNRTPSYDIPPTFVGGEKALQKYLNSNLIYDSLSSLNQIFGETEFTFTIDKEGNIKDFLTEFSFNKTLIDESKRLMLNMPKWTPAMKNDVKVDTRIHAFIAINFNTRKVSYHEIPHQNDRL